MSKTITIVSREELPNLFRYVISDDLRQKHTVEIPGSVLTVDPAEFKRGSNVEHLDIIACGAVLMDLDRDARFHKVDDSMVNRSYAAASKAQILGQFGN